MAFAGNLRYHQLVQHSAGKDLFVVLRDTGKAVMVHNAVHSGLFFGRVVDDRNHAGADNTFVVRRPLAGGVALHDLQKTVGFKGGVGIIPHHVHLAPLPCGMEIESEHIIFLCKAKIERDDIGGSIPRWGRKRQPHNRASRENREQRGVVGDSAVGTAQGMSLHKHILSGGEQGKREEVPAVFIGFVWLFVLLIVYQFSPANAIVLRVFAQKAEHIACPPEPPHRGETSCACLGKRSAFPRSGTGFTFAGKCGKIIENKYLIFAATTKKGSEHMPVQELARWDKQLAFLVEVDKMKTVLRQTLLADKSRQENDAEHSWHFALMAMLLLEYATDKNLDLLHILKMALVHDLVEVYAGDTFAYDVQGNRDKEAREQEAADKIFGLLPQEQGTELHALWVEFDAMETPEARYAAAIDRLQPFISNSVTDGHTWKIHGVKKSQVLARMDMVRQATPDLWQFVENVIADAIEKGYIIAE